MGFTGAKPSVDADESVAMLRERAPASIRRRLDDGHIWNRKRQRPQRLTRPQVVRV
jgi:hypothetical protein